MSIAVKNGASDTGRKPERLCAALLLSGGTGSRLGAGIPKQYIRTGGRMMITRSLYALFQCPEIDAVQIVAEEARQAEIQADWQGFQEELQIEASGKAGQRKQDMSQAQHGEIQTGNILKNEHRICGYSLPGENRQMSIFNGLQDLAKIYGEESIVLIHDAARPFVSAAQIQACMDACRLHDGAMPVLPMKDTVYYSEDGEAVSRLLEREKVFAGQAPEAFVLGKYLAANRALLPDRILQIKGSTEPAVMAGMDIAMIPGDEGNFKITTKADFERYEAILHRTGTDAPGGVL